MQTPGKFDDLMRQGLGLHQAGRIDEAASIYRKVLAKLPSHPGANHLLGLTLLNQGRAPDAVTHIARAVHVRGDDAEYRNNLGVALNAAGRSAEAVAELDRAIALRPDYPAAMNNRGLALKALGRHADAALSFESALKLKPNEAGFLNNLGNALAESGDWWGAEKCYRSTLNVRPGHVGATAALAGVLLKLGRTDEAISLATAAIAANPAEPEFHRALGYANFFAGRPEESASAYRGLLALRPDDAEGHRMLGSLIRRTPGDPEVAAIASLLSRPDLPDESRAQLEFALGQALDDIGEYDAAFTHFSTGNALVKKLRPFDPAGVEDEMLRFFKGLPDSRIPPLAPPTGPILIVGLPRSGKSTLEGMLARHNEVFAADELPMLNNAVAATRRGRALDDIAPEAFVAMGQAYTADLSRIAPGRRVIDTMPNNYRLVGLLRLAAPSARVIYCTRDPLEHGTAVFQKYFAKGGNEYASDLGQISAKLRDLSDLMAFWEQRFPGYVRHADLAELNRSPEAGMRQLLEFLGLGRESACALPFESEPRLGPASRKAAERYAPYAAGLLGPEGRKN